MKFYPIAAISLLSLTACMDAQPIQGSIDSQANRLSVGMTLNEVEPIIGPSAFRTPNGNTTCTSHIYDETIAAKFVHVVFEDGVVVSASDGHRKAC